MSFKRIIERLYYVTKCLTDVPRDLVVNDTAVFLVALWQHESMHLEGEKILGVHVSDLSQYTCKVLER